MPASLAHVTAALDKDSPPATIYAPQFTQLQGSNRKPPLVERGPPNRANQHEILAVAVALSAVLPALLATLAALLARVLLAGILVLLAGVLVLLAGLLATTALLLTGLLAALLLAALVRVLRILAHRFLPWVPSPGSQQCRAANVPQRHENVVTIPPIAGATF